MNCGPMTELMTAQTEDAFLGGRLRLRQLKSGHRAGHDAMLLAAGTSARAGERVVDFGAGVGAAGLALARRVAGIDLALVEIDELLASLARGNAALNAIDADVLVLDVEADAAAFAAAGLMPDSADARDDESALQRCDPAPRFARCRAGDRACGARRRRCRTGFTPPGASSNPAAC